MSANMAPSAPAYTSADITSFGSNWPRPTHSPVPSSGPATQQVQGVSRPVTATAATDGGNPSIPWLGFVVALLVLRVLSHMQKG